MANFQGNRSLGLNPMVQCMYIDKGTSWTWEWENEFKSKFSFSIFMQIWRMNVKVDWRFSGSRDYLLFTKTPESRCMQEFEIIVLHSPQRISITSISVKIYLTTLLTHLVQFLYMSKLQHTQQMKSRIYLRKIQKCLCKISYLFSHSLNH